MFHSTLWQVNSGWALPQEKSWLRYKLSYFIYNYIYSIFNYINRELGKSDITYILIETRLTRLTDEKTEIKELFGKNVFLD